MKKILIIEDEIAYVKLLREKLSENYTVQDAKDGKDGLEKALKTKPDLILLDIRMPILNGFEVLHELRKDAYGKHAKVILLTNLEPDADMLEKILTDKPLYYFVKSDIELMQLLTVISEALA